MVLGHECSRVSMIRDVYILMHDMCECMCKVLACTLECICMRNKWYHVTEYVFTCVYAACMHVHTQGHSNGILILATNSVIYWCTVMCSYAYAKNGICGMDICIHTYVCKSACMCMSYVRDIEALSVCAHVSSVCTYSCRYVYKVRNMWYVCMCVYVCLHVHYDILYIWMNWCTCACMCVYIFIRSLNKL